MSKGIIQILRILWINNPQLNKIITTLLKIKFNKRTFNYFSKQQLVLMEVNRRLQNT